MGSVFEKMISDLSKQDASHMLEECMSFNPKTTGRIPLRYRIIALGFVKKLSLDDVNRKLQDAGCETLYARNFWEATLIYSFANGMTYNQWQELQDYICTSAEFALDDGEYFQNRNITYRELRDYVRNNSDEEEAGLYTQRRTCYLERNILGLSKEREEFREFMLQNIRQFSRVREKARYYFCKYLYYYMEQKIEGYLKAENMGFGKKQAFSDLIVFKGISEISRKKMGPEEIRSVLENAGVSCGGIYDAFNRFFFEYVSSDWMDVLLDYYGGNIRMLPQEEKRQLAKSLRAYNSKWKKLNDDEVLLEKWQEMQQEEAELDRIYALDGNNRGFQRNRSGEKSVRNYIKGSIDIDRTTLICYLLFFGYDLRLEEQQMINRERLDEILFECRMPGLREKDDFDMFVIQYLLADDPVDYLMESVTNYAFQEKNFFLYHMYNESINNEEQLKKILGVK